MKFSKYKMASKILVPIIGAYNVENFVNYIKNPYSQWEDEFKCIFIHVPKAAGKSVSKVLLGAPNGTGHNKLYCYERSLGKFNSYKKIAVVRNPWDRLVSAFYYIKQFDMKSNDRKFFDEYIGQSTTFNEFVMKLSDDNYAELILKWEHFTLQVDFIKDSRGEIRLDYLAKLETLDDDFIKLKRLINVNASPLKKMNTSTHSYYKENYDEEMIEIVRHVYREDIDSLNYCY